MIERIIYIGFNKFKNNIPSKIIMIIELVLIMYLLNIMIGMYRHDTYVLNMIKDMNLGESYHISEYNGSLYEDRYYDVGELEKSETNDGLKVMIYNNAIVENIHLPLSKGFWFTEYTGNKLPIILSYSYARTNKIKIGDIIEKEIYNNGNKRVIICEVIGILAKQNYYINLSVTSSELKWNNIFVTHEETAIINNNSFIRYPEKPKMIFMKNKENNKVIVEELSKQGLLTSSFNLTKNTKNHLYYKLEEQLILWVLLLSLIIVTLVSNNMLEKIYEEKEFAVYYMLGLSWANCIIVEIIRSVLHVLIASILAIILIKCTYSQNGYSNLYMDS